MPSHDESHVERVKKLAEFIAVKEGADLEIVMRSAELHDISRFHNPEGSTKNHAIESAKIARDVLAKEGCDEEFIECVVHCIESHSFSSGIHPKTLEAKVLSDADKLDAIGAIGIARAFMFSGERGRGIEETLRHFDEKLLKLYNMLHTKTAREIGKERHEFLKMFYHQIKKELGKMS
jgi:uncharacterized protein